MAIREAANSVSATDKEWVFLSVRNLVVVPPTAKRLHLEILCSSKGT